jgi:hypothetical protein
MVRESQIGVRSIRAQGMLSQPLILRQSLISTKTIIGRAERKPAKNHALLEKRYVLYDFLTLRTALIHPLTVCKQSLHPLPPPTRVTRIFGSRAQHVRGSELGFFWSLTSQSNSGLGTRSFSEFLRQSPEGGHQGGSIPYLIVDRYIAES